MSSNQICPQFITWRSIFAILDEAWRKKGNKKNPPPNVFNFQGWTKSSNEKKKKLWAATLTWADKNGFEDLIPELYDDDMFEGE